MQSVNVVVPDQVHEHVDRVASGIRMTRVDVELAAEPVALQCDPGTGRAVGNQGSRQPVIRPLSDGVRRSDRSRRAA